MPGQPGGLKVEGIPQTNIALRQVANFDVEAAGSNVTSALLAGVVNKTRTLTGSLAAAWSAPGNEFVNTMPYSVAQEFGTVYVDPTFAVFQTWDEQEIAVKEAFHLEINNAAEKAGFDT